MIKVVLLPPLGKLSHGSKAFPLFSVPIGNKVNIYGRAEPRSYRGDHISPPLPLPAAARRGAGDAEIQKMRNILTLFFLVEADKMAEANADGDSLAAKNKINNWYTIHPIGMRRQPGL
ncbi:hypothetical protein lerEdw1_016818 [Lerista edwardsae]|nr:hypothetical protein lerEdw1_016818 [Lerista edwardsae]